MIVRKFSKAKKIQNTRIIYVNGSVFVMIATKKGLTTSMAKKVWAKGRKQEQYKVAISKESHELLSKLADEAKMTRKDFIYALVTKYKLKDEDNK